MEEPTWGVDVTLNAISADFSQRTESEYALVCEPLPDGGWLVQAQSARGTSIARASGEDLATVMVKAMGRAIAACEEIGEMFSELTSDEGDDE